MSFARHLVLPGLLSLAGCSNTASVTTETLHYALWGTDDVIVSKEHISALPYASAYVKIGDNPRVFVVLAFVNGDELSWLTADKVMIVTRHGRIIKTVGMANDLVVRDASYADPLSLEPVVATGWSSTAEWARDYLSGYQLDSQLLQQGQDELDLVTRRLTATRFEETVLMVPGTVSWTNQFWRDPATGQVVKSVQRLGPGLPDIELTILKPYSP